MNMLAYEADKAWNRGIPCIFFKKLIQLYLLHSFLYSLTYCIKEVIKDKKMEIKWKKWWPMRQLRPETGESLTIFQNTNKRLYVLCTNFFTYCIIKGIKVKKFSRWIEKVWAYETDFLAWIRKKNGWKIYFDR